MISTTTTATAVAYMQLDEHAHEDAAVSVSGNSPCMSSWTPSSLGPTSPMWVDSGMSSHRGSSLPLDHKQQHEHEESRGDSSLSLARLHDDEICVGAPVLDGDGSPTAASGDTARIIALSRPLPLESHRSSPNPNQAQPSPLRSGSLGLPAAGSPPRFLDDDEEDEVVGVTAEGELLFRRRDGSRHQYQALPMPSPSPVVVQHDATSGGVGYAVHHQHEHDDLNGNAAVSSPMQHASPSLAPQGRQMWASMMVTPNHVVPLRPTPRAVFGGQPQPQRVGTTLQYTAASPLAAGGSAHDVNTHDDSTSISISDSTAIVELSPHALWMHEMSLRMRDRENDVYYEMVQDEIHRAVAQREAAERSDWLLRMENRAWDLRRL